MTCGTHAMRDELALVQEGQAPVLAEKPEFQCQCMFGIQCQRRATDEDFRCDWCRAIEGNRKPSYEYPGHEEWLLKQQRLNFTARPSQFQGLYAAEPMPLVGMPTYNYMPASFQRAIDVPVEIESMGRLMAGKEYEIKLKHDLGLPET
jgi:hypothetical protein